MAGPRVPVNDAGRQEDLPPGWVGRLALLLGSLVVCVPVAFRIYGDLGAGAASGVLGGVFLAVFSGPGWVRWLGCGCLVLGLANVALLVFGDH